uniref:Uncharacterized protein n=1 Tax=Neobodo designis TaxID=312471 RepID=A0A7S1Q649_NEODS|mmetsp:Transcript_31667/g.97907  ORF Transcript_31667/g.97907 Transcript_31667/m.97907 type:complete len:152 (+) Transcript_31667:150-605(+)|eukprot:CAMPEP_0174856548 /NCGR_PEP_ID=MMETSP1114-20130205/36093_1 /TAXON_ID=312471 /ORGANISM="Neobodo designis, Strain CCAP 1951/1" /LENGTH=151 /DNA_ID=CAMNT_0016091349 /DNA_START=150 /DNA_END=605 /DNA_ORIENTATION=+
MVAIFPSDGLAWGVGIVVGAVIAGLILLAIIVALRKTLCPRRELDESDNRFEQTMPAAPREDDPDAALEIESTGSQDIAPEYVGTAFGDSKDEIAVRHIPTNHRGESDEDDRGGHHSEREESDPDLVPPHSVRNVVMRRTAAGNAARRWRY